MRVKGGVPRLLALAILALLSASSLGVSHALAASTTSTTATTSTAPLFPTSLAISVIPPKLPADGGSYPALVVAVETSTGTPALALNDTVVFLTSSQEGVGAVAPEVTILKGSGFAVANFTTSESPGTTTISASSSGLSATSIQLTTLTPSGFPTHLSVIPVPGAQPTNPGGRGTVLVETLDSSGLPAATGNTLVVTLSSSNNNVVSIPSPAVSFAAGAVLSSTSYEVGTAPGTATITGSASGFNSGSGTVDIQGAVPVGLQVSPEPNRVATSTTGRLVLSLVDQQGQPAQAPSPIAVVISSSNTTVVSASQSATIPAGQDFVVASFTAGSSPGFANLTVASPGLKSASAQVTVSVPASPVQLTLFMAPNPVPADNGSYDSLVVALTGSNGGPAVASEPVSVTLTSSDSLVGQVEEALVIPEGSSFGVAAFQSTYLAGSTSITAIAQNFESASTIIGTFGPTPTQVVARALPATLPADGGSYPALEIMLEDASGQPAFAAMDTTVQLTSSSTNLAGVAPTVVIPAGSSYVLTMVTTSDSSGIANITAVASGFAPSSTEFSTARPSPSQLGLYVAPTSGIMSSAPGGNAIVAVQLQDSTSAPARARQPTSVVVTSSNSTMISKPIHLTVPTGEDYAWAFVNSSAAGVTTLTASSNGLGSASAALTQSAVPVSFTLTSSVPTVTVGGAAAVTAQVEVMGSPVSGALVSITASSGTMSVASGTTDSSGQFTDTFIPAVNGVATISAVASDPLFGNQTNEINILVLLPGAAASSSTASKIPKLLELLLPVVVVVVVVAILVVFLRRTLRKRTKAAEEGQDTDADVAAISRVDLSTGYGV